MHPPEKQGGQEGRKESLTQKELLEVTFFFKFVYFERQSTNGGGADTEGEKEDPKQAPRCQHRA